MKNPLKITIFECIEKGFLGNRNVPLSQQIDKAYCNTSVNIEDEVGLLLGGDLLHLPGVVQQWCAGEVLLSELCHQGDSLVRVVQALDSVPDAHDQPALLLGVVDKVHGDGAGIKGLSEHPSRIIKGAAEAVADGEQAGDQGGDEVLARPRAHNGVVSSGDRGPVVGGDHQAHLQELAGVRWKPALEPEKTKDPADAHVLSKHLGNGDAGVQELLTTLVTDATHKAGWLPNQTQLTSPENMFS